MVILTPLLIGIVINKMVNNWLEMIFRIMMKLSPPPRSSVKVLKRVVKNTFFVSFIIVFHSLWYKFRQSFRMSEFQFLKIIITVRIYPLFNRSYFIINKGCNNKSSLFIKSKPDRTKELYSVTTHYQLLLQKFDGHPNILL